MPPPKKQGKKKGKQGKKKDDDFPEDMLPQSSPVAATPEAAAAAATPQQPSATAAATSGPLPPVTGAAAPGEPLRQTTPPTVAVSQLYPDGHFPPGETQYYQQQSNLWRRESAEAKEREKLNEGMYEQLRQAAAAHKQVRQWARSWIKPGMRMIDIADAVEESLRRTIGADGLERGIAFPTGLSLNNCAAHWTPNAGDTTVLGEHDVLKVDIGLHVGGRIIDSAFTMAFDPQFDGLLEAVREATNAGVAACGVDVRLTEIGAVVQEVMESHEVTINGHTYPIKTVRNLFGHSLGLYQIHSSKSVPNVKGAGEAVRIEEGDLLAIETFGSTGHGFVQDDLETSHYMRSFVPMPMQSIRGGKGARELLAHISKCYGSLAFARRWLDHAGFTRYALNLRTLIDCGAVIPCPPLCDIRGSFVAQFEHTVGIKASSKEVFSRGDDY